MPTNQPRNDTVMNKPIFVRITGTPTARALAAFPPTAKIQLPILVRCSTHAEIAMNSAHQITVPQTVTTPTWKLEENTLPSEVNPSIWEMSGVDTDPVTSLVTPRLAPCSTKNVPSVIRKLGMPVRITRYPFRKPIARQNTSESAAPTHRLIPNHQQNMELTSPAVVTMTPAERSNSPPIINMPTPTATMPMVEAW